jgi:hypothetical protein
MQGFGQLVRSAIIVRIEARGREGPPAREFV